MSCLFLTYAKENCGVYQYGQGIYKALQEHSTDMWHHAAVQSLAEIDNAVEEHNPDVVVYNWHGATLGQLVHPANPRRYTSCKNIAILHELSHGEGSALPLSFFQAFTITDPTFPHCVAPQLHPLPRCIPKMVETSVSVKDSPDRPSFGSFGFAVASKGWEYLAGSVERDYDKATLRLHIPPSWAVDPTGDRARFVAQSVRDMVTKDVIVEASHNLLEQQELLQWLASNTLNMFTYYPGPHTGISSSVDWAIASGRPFAVSPSGLFKHLQHLPIIVGHNCLKGILADGDKWAKILQYEWSEEKFVSKFYKIIEGI